MRGLLPFDGFSVIRRWIISSAILRLHTKTMCLYPRWILRIKRFLWNYLWYARVYQGSDPYFLWKRNFVPVRSERGTDGGKDDDRHYIRRERSSSVFRRQFNVKGIKEDGIKAGLKDGILTITLPKLPQEIEKAPHRIQIDWRWCMRYSWNTEKFIHAFSPGGTSPVPSIFGTGHDNPPLSWPVFMCP